MLKSIEVQGTVIKVAEIYRHCGNSALLAKVKAVGYLPGSGEAMVSFELLSSAGSTSSGYHRLIMNVINFISQFEKAKEGSNGRSISKERRNQTRIRGSFRQTIDNVVVTEGNRNQQSC